jgi:ABC-type multidrug transport system ATPase subunit/pSer/pThr/pTyr-binding forkhead associated (FHA) protein
VTGLSVAGPGGTLRLEPDGGGVRVGRDPLCRLVVDDPRVSREHLEIGWHGAGWRLRDLDTRNGTYGPAGRVTTLDLTGPYRLRLGAPDGPELFLQPDAAPLPETTFAPAAGTPPGHAPPAGPWAGPGPAPPGAGPGAEAPGAAVAGAGAAPVEPWIGAVASGTYAIGGRMRIGRAPDNDVVLDDLQVSRWHAEVHRTATGARLVDLGTRNGSYHNGSRVSGAELRPGDVLAFGRHRLVFDGERLRGYADAGPVSLRADALTVTIKNRRLLDQVGFALDGSSLLAVVGPSGAGKSTLLGALTGYRPATAGTVSYDGRDLYADYDELRHRIGLVPQDDILHAALTVRRALRYAAALRFEPDVTAAERDRRIGEVLAQLGLTAQAEQRIDKLSGGQRKRTSVALELLTEPSLLFLDEPTSGLDPALDRDVMTGLRQLADRGRTVVVVTHSPLHLDTCDRVLVLARGGRVAYFGPPARLLDYFGAAAYADVFQQVSEHPELWADRWTAAAPVTPAAPPQPFPGQALPGQPFPGHAGGPGGAGLAGGPVGTGVAGGQLTPAAEAAPARQGRWRQLAVLTRRMVAVTVADRLYAALLLGLPLGLAALLHVIPGGDGLARPGGPLGRSLEAEQLLVVLIVGAVFIGLAGGIRELVRERAIYRRERAVGLSPAAYLGSKLAVFAAVNAVQAALFTLVGLAGRDGPADALVLRWPLLELIAVVWLTTLVSTLAGLLVSAYVSTGEQTMPILVGMVMAQLVLSGGLFAVVGRTGVEQVSWLAPARWAYAAAAATVDLRSLMPNAPADALWDHRPAAWLWAVAVLAGQGLLLAVAARWALRRHEPGR